MSLLTKKKTKFRLEDQKIFEVRAILKVNTSELGVPAGSSEQRVGVEVSKELDAALRAWSDAIEIIAQDVTHSQSQLRSLKVYQSEE